MFSPRNLMIAGVVLVAVALGLVGPRHLVAVRPPVGACRTRAVAATATGTPAGERPDGVTTVGSRTTSPCPRRSPTRRSDRHQAFPVPLTGVGDDGGMTTLPPADELLARAHVVALPMRVRFRGVDVREALLIEGPAGWGEFSPFVEYADSESARWLAAGIEAAYAVWPAPVRDAVSVNATVPAVGPDRVPEVLARFDGCTTAKVKVAERGQTLDDDVDRVAAVRSAMGPSARIRVDANGGWDVETATEALRRLTAYDLEYAEQPCATSRSSSSCERHWRATGSTSSSPPTSRSARPRTRSVSRRLGAADVVVVKVAPLGGVRAALEIVEACGLPAVVSSALDTSVGIAAGVALAAALPSLDHACGLGTVGLFERDVVGDAVAPDGRTADDRDVPCPTRRHSPTSRRRPSGSSGGATGSSAATPCSTSGGAP